ncbi:primosomal protein N' [Buchnera aphidicola]|uniref:replication restart helicase PriA n=1 Tax=Buchnera aphidicola TaxID=9 RepID=UPI003464388C
MIIVEVVLPFSIRQRFKYFMSDIMYPIIGGRIVVPFRSKDIVGIVVSFYEIEDIRQLNFKFVKSLIDTQSLYTNILLDIIFWINRNYQCFIGNLFFSILPRLLRNKYLPKDTYIYEWIITKKGQETDCKSVLKKTKKLSTLIFLKQKNILSSELKRYNICKNILKNLEIEGLCRKSLYFKPLLKHTYICKSKKKFFLNKKILDCINNIMIKKQFSSWLLTKISLYEKVKFYLGLIDFVLNNNMQILIIVPYFKDIKIIFVFLNKFFNITIDSMHSKLTNMQYLNNWMRIKKGENSIVIGTKKSIFLPFLKLGLIIILEEHDLNYKKTDHCRYNVRDIGILRAYKENIPVVLDSDTPSLKTLHNIFLKKCFYIEIKKRNNIRHFNDDIIDLKKEKIKFSLSSSLIHEVNNNFKKKQVLFILNNFSLSFLVLICNCCKFVLTCVNCNNYFEVNQYHNILFCRFCLIKIKQPLFCYHCKSLSLIIKNIGIENVKNKIQEIFPKKPLFFLLNKKKINKNVIDKKSFEFFSSNPYIIFSTEDIVHNYYFPYVKLISLTCIDNYFFSFQFRAIEYFAQFYMNLRKLSKKNTKSLKILIQTSFSNDLNLKELYNNGYFSFANKILSIRKKFLLPPWSVQSIIYSESIDPKRNMIFLNLMFSILKKKSKKYNCFLWYVGPHPSCFLKNKKHVHQLLIQCSSHIYLNNLLNECIDLINYFSIAKKVKWFIDIEPI